MRSTDRFVLAATIGAVVLGTAALPQPVRANEDEMAVVDVRMPRAEVRIGNQEAVITYMPPVAATDLTAATPQTMTAYLQRYASGEPTAGALVEMTVDFVPGELAEVAPGVYQSHDWQLPAGKSEIEMAVTIDGTTQTATIPFNVVTTSGPRPRAPIAIPVVSVPGYVFASAAGVIYGLVVLLFLARRRRRSATRSAAHHGSTIGIGAHTQGGSLVRT